MHWRSIVFVCLDACNVKRLEGSHPLVLRSTTIFHVVQSAIHANVTMKLVDIALDSDRDESALFSEKEIESLLFKLKQVQGIEIDEAVFRQAMKKDNSLRGVLTLLQHAATDTQSSIVMKQKDPKRQAGVTHTHGPPVFSFVLPNESGSSDNTIEAEA